MNSLIPLIVIHFLSLLSPGPDVFYVLSSSTTSLKRGLLAGFGIFLGNAILVSLILLLGQQTLLRLPNLFVLIKIAGVVYLFYTGIRIAYLEIVRPQVSNGIENKVQLRRGEFEALQGCIMCITNPKAVLYFFSFLPAYLFLEGKINWLGVTIVLSLSCFWFLSIAFLGNRIFNFISFEVKRKINLFFSGALIFFSIFIFREVIQ